MTYEEEMRLIADKVEGLSDDDWATIKDELNYEYTTDALRKSAAGKYGGVAVYNYFKDKQYDNNSDELLEIQKERIKLNDTKNEYKELIRAKARNESFNEKIIEAINNLKPLDFTNNIEYVEDDNSRIGVLFVSDAHFGKELIFRGLNGEIINEYSPKIFTERMNNLLSQVVYDYYTMPIDKLIVCDCGDAVDGILRVSSQLQKLKTGIIDSAIQYSDFMAQWLTTLQHNLHIPIEYRLTTGNHDIIRILQSKPAFEDENVAKIINQFIQLRLKDNNNILVTDYSEVEYFNVLGTNILAFHGDVKNLQQTLEFYQNYYDIKIDIICGGHLHHDEESVIGFGSMGNKIIMRVPSICGTDDFAKSVNKCSMAGAKYITFTKSGKSWSKDYILP